MSTLEYSAALALDLPTMDDTHREFVQLLAAAEGAADAALPAAWNALIAHTDLHFSQEDRWMREGARRGETGQLDVIRQMARELAGWFPQHARSMDAALALHLRSLGFDFATGVVKLPHALSVDEIRGCGLGACSPSPIPASMPA